MKIYAYKNSSKSARALAKALGCKLIKHENSKCSWKELVINWGCSDFREGKFNETVYPVLNKPYTVEWAVNKESTLFWLDCHNVSTLEWTTYKPGAVKWIEEGKTVVCRTLTNSHSGKGIVIADTVGELVDAPLYTQYIPKKWEFRVHVVNGKVIDIQEKLKRKGVEHDTRIRNAANGYVYARTGLIERHSTRIDRLGALGIDALRALKLDFGAVDIIWNDKRDQGYVCEVNSAPGITGTTVDLYAEAFKNYPFS